jgi:hypothetical protein
MLHRLIGDGKLSQVVANHLRLHAMPITYPKNSVCSAPEPKNAAIQKASTNYMIGTESFLDYPEVLHALTTTK